jgi:S1-C subfamily serine protease
MEIAAFSGRGVRVGGDSMKKAAALLLSFLTVLLVACDGFTLWPMSSTLTTPETGSEGTITFQESDYYSYPYYSSPNYHLDNINEYNDLLMATRDHIRRANVQIQTTVYRTGKIFPGVTQTIVDSISTGSGVVFLEHDGYYYFLTNQHVIEGEGTEIEYEIYAFGDEMSSAAELVCADADLDLAVLRFAKESRTEVEIIDMTTRLFTRFTPGELVLAVGNPLSVENNVTFGEFNSMESIPNATFKVLYHSATIHEGSSGGALVDIDGNLIGLNSWGTEENDEESFAIPVYIIHVFLYNNGLS